MAYNVYQGDNLIAEKITEKEYTAEGLTPNTEYSFSVSEVIGDKESEKATITVKTKPVNVTGVELSPKNMTGEAGTASNRQLNPTVAPENATNKGVTYSVEPTAEGLTINSSGVLVWTDAVGAGEYTVTVKTTDGNKTATSTLTLSAPEPEPEPEE